MVIVNPLSRVVGPLPNGLYGLQIRATNSNSDDPPSSEMEHLLQMNQPSPTPSTLCRACVQSITKYVMVQKKSNIMQRSSSFDSPLCCLCSNPSGFGGRFWVPKHLLTGYLEHKGHTCHTFLLRNDLFQYPWNYLDRFTWHLGDFDLRG